MTFRLGERALRPTLALGPLRKRAHRKILKLSSAQLSLKQAVSQCNRSRIVGMDFKQRLQACEGALLIT